MDIFDNKGLKPMLIAEQEEPFDSEDFIYEIKLDGIRCIAYLDETGTDLRNKRDKKLLPHVPELSNIHKQVKGKCILDGELFILKNGVTDFYEIQKRVMMSDPFRIQLAAQKYPASFVAYDIVYLNDKQIDMLPLMERKMILNDTVVETERISISRYIEQKGIQLFELAKQNGLEGIVAKRKDSLYTFDKRSKNWIKCKVMSTDDCVICGYIPKEHNMISFVLGQYDGDILVYKGHVTLGASLRILNQYEYKRIEYSPFGEVPKGNENATWLEPSLVCIVESMPTEKESFRQPVFKGIRNDKIPTECKIRE
ncbi:ATP-dependent DNA ligase [Anaerosporobacter faecicola]|uniref:ATP-dependent DNA ligase n=1 Tax=Anaerosporobacter faecicola TaxID=2718714 RepID=UPI001438BC72|nr:RNA ligase family protein [Anaerosporobacter faecicola]